MEISNNLDNSKKNFNEILNLLEELEGVANQVSNEVFSERILLLKKNMREIVISIKNIRDTTSSALVSINHKMIDTIGQFANITISKYKDENIKQDIEELRHLEENLKNNINHLYKFVETIFSQEIIKECELLNKEIVECYKEVENIEKGLTFIEQK